MQPAEAADVAPNVVIIEEAPAAASPPVVIYQDPPKPEKPPEREEWYGVQTVLMDGISGALLLGGALVQEGSAGHQNTGAAAGLYLTGGLTYVAGAPIVHFAHGRIGPGFGSFALRVGLPLEFAFDGFLIGAALTRYDSAGNPRSDTWAWGTGIGFVGGLVGASVIDAVFLARYKTTEVDPEAYDPKVDATNDRAKNVAHAKPFHVEWTPTASPITGGATVGVGGVF